MAKSTIRKKNNSTHTKPTELIDYEVLQKETERSRELHEQLYAKLIAVGVLPRDLFQDLGLPSNPLREMGLIALQPQDLKARVEFIRTGERGSGAWGKELSKLSKMPSNFGEGNHWHKWSGALAQQGIPFIESASAHEEFWSTLRKGLILSLPLFRDLEHYMRSGLFGECLPEGEIKITPSELVSQIPGAVIGNAESAMRAEWGWVFREDGSVIRFIPSASRMSSAYVGNWHKDKKIRQAIEQANLREAEKILAAWIPRIRNQCEAMTAIARAVLSVIQYLVRAQDGLDIDPEEVCESVGNVSSNITNADSETPANGKWNDEELKLLRDLYKANYTYGQIQKKLPHRSRDAVISRLRRLGLSRSKPTQPNTPRQPRKNVSRHS